MADSSENSELLVEKKKSIPENSEKEETIPINEENQEANKEVAPEKPAARTRGRPAGSKDNKPRIRRVPVLQPPPQQQQQQEEQVAKKRSQKTVRIHEEEEPQPAEPDDPEEKLPPPPPKSPRTLHRERVQAGHATATARAIETRSLRAHTR